MTSYLSDMLDAGPGSSPLGALDDDQLAALLTARPDLTDPPPPNLASLENRADSWNSVLACYYSLDLAGQQVMQALSLLPASTTVDALAKLLDATATQLDPVLDRLAALFLLTRADGLRVARFWHHHAPRAGLGPPLAELLPKLQVDALRGIAQKIGAERPARKSDLVAAIGAELLRPGRVAALLAGAPEPVVELATLLAGGPPTVDVPYSYSPGHREETPVDWLRARGLIVGPGWGQATMASEVAIALRGGRIFPDLQLTKPELELLPVDAGAVDSGGFERARQLVHDLLRLLEELEQRPAALLKGGGVGMRDVRRLAGTLGVSEPVAAQLIELAAAARLLGRDVATGQVMVAAGYDGWRDGDTVSRWSALVQAWLGMRHHLNLAGSPDAKDKPFPPLVGHPDDEDATRLRHLLLSALAEAESGRAVTEDSLVAVLWWGAPSAWACSPMALLGELDLLGLASARSLSALGRALTEGGLTQAAAALAGLLPKPVTEFVLQADLTAIASGELAPDVRHELELMADRESSGGATVYRFSPDTVRRALDQGRDSAALLEFLHAHARRGVPQPLEYLINDLGRRFGQLRLRAAGCYVRSEDTALLAELARTRAFAGLGLALIAPTVLVSSAGEASVLAALRAEGYLPAVEGADGAIQVQLLDRPRASASAPPPPTGARDVTSLIAQLRQAPIAPTGAPPRLVPLPSYEDPDGPDRPTYTADDPASIAALLELAIEEEWAVGLSRGRSEKFVLPYVVDEDHLLGEYALSGSAFTVRLDEITSLRVLDLDEELGIACG